MTLFEGSGGTSKHTHRKKDMEDITEIIPEDAVLWGSLKLNSMTSLKTAETNGWTIEQLNERALFPQWYMDYCIVLIEQMRVSWLAGNMQDFTIFNKMFIEVSEKLGVVGTTIMASFCQNTGRPPQAVAVWLADQQALTACSEKVAARLAEMGWGGEFIEVGDADD